MRLRLSQLTRTSLLLAVFFGLDKAIAILRQVVIARQFGLSTELDVFNVANNIPDLLFALISGGALAMAFIPVLAEVLTHQGRRLAWDLFSRIANLAFLVTAGLAIIVAILAGPMVRGEIGIAPGFTPNQQNLVAELMRLNLIATLIFSISGLVMAGLQSNKHFFLPALAPILYNIGQIFGAVVLAPEKGYSIGPLMLPAFGLGVHGLVYGVIVGAVLHLAIQIPGLIAYQFHWIPRIDLQNPDVKKVLRLLGPRLITVFCVQLIFIVRDNLASRLAAGSVSSLTYGWMIQQVPETLIGTAIGTALLPTLAEQFSCSDQTALRETIGRAVRVLIALTIPTAVILGIGLTPLVSFAFGFDSQGTQMLMWATRGFLVGLVGHSVLEVASRSFYAQQDAVFPLIGSGMNLAIYILLGSQMYRWLGAPGISLTDSIAFSSQAVFLFIVLAKKKSITFSWRSSMVRACVAGLAAGAVAFGIQWIGADLPNLAVSLAMMAAGAIVSLPIIWPEIRTLVRL
jgi:putative peptidoglycan lipid II flippase